MDVPGRTITVEVPIQGGFGANRPIKSGTIYNVTAFTFGRSELPATPTESDFLYTEANATRSFDFNLVPQVADLVVAKTDAPDPAHVGQPLVYTVDVTNRGPLAATGVRLTDHLPKNAGFGSVSTAQGTCSLKPEKRLVNCDLVSVAAGATVRVTILVKPTAKGTVSNAAEARRPPRRTPTPRTTGTPRPRRSFPRTRRPVSCHRGVSGATFGWAPLEVVGREGEVSLIRAFLDDTSSWPSALLLEGEAGIGKTTLWRAAVREATDRSHRVLAAQPTQAERSLSFAGLVDLLDPVADAVLPELPAPQREALEAALLRGPAGGQARPGAVAVAVARAIRLLAGSGPLVIAVDDLQWLDHATARVLEFGLRRLSAEPVGAILTCRPDPSLPRAIEGSLGAHRVRRLEVGPLSLSAVYRLIHGTLGVAPGRPTLIRLHQASGGNPLFALELARALEQGGPVHPGRPLPVPGSLLDLLRRRLARLPSRTRRVLLVAAAMSAPRPPDLRRVLPSTVDVSAELERAEQAGVVEVAVERPGEVIRFTHPLLASAVYDGATRSHQRQVHRSLAQVVADPEERARHLSLAAPGPDEEVASALDRAVASAGVRGATDVAAQLAEQALALTPPGDGDSAFHRALAAGILTASAGDPARARALLEHAVAGAPPGPRRAEALLRLAELADPLGRGVALCREALEQAGPDPALRSRIHRTAGAIEYFLGNVPAAEEHARMGVRLAEEAGDARALGMALAELGHWTFCGGGGVRRDVFERAIGLDPSPGAASPRSHLAKVLMDAGFLEEARAMLAELLSETMAAGDLQGAAAQRLHLAELELWAGDWPAAVGDANESLLLRQHADQPRAPGYVRAMALACLGQVEEARKEAEAGLAEARRAEDVVFLMQNLHVLGFVELSLGDHAAAHAHLARATDLLRPRWNREFGDCHVIPDEIESAVALGELDRAEDLVRWMEEVGERTGRAWTLATGERARGLLLAALGDLEGADRALDRALGHHEALPMPMELARTLLAKGTVERRRRRWAAARSTFDRAVDILDRLGAEIWAARARGERDRIGVRTEAQRDLTPVEARIARLVAEGHTNREIADRLSLSRKTVEASLSHVYRKLGIRSRAGLAAALSRRPGSS